jgi:hypothetical protein
MPTRVDCRDVGANLDDRAGKLMSQNNGERDSCVRVGATGLRGKYWPAQVFVHISATNAAICHLDPYLVWAALSGGRSVTVLESEEPPWEGPNSQCRDGVQPDISFAVKTDGLIVGILVHRDENCITFAPRSALPDDW